MVTGRAKRSGVAGLRRDPTCGGTGHTGTRPRSYFPGRCRRLRPWWLSAQAPRSGRLWVSRRGGCRATDRGSGGVFGFDSLGFTPRPLICRGVPSQRQRPLLLPNDSAAQEVVGVSISIAMCGCRRTSLWGWPTAAASFDNISSRPKVRPDPSYCDWSFVMMVGSGR
jgi:hypothetical protein